YSPPGRVRRGVRAGKRAGMCEKRWMRKRVRGQEGPRRENERSIDVWSPEGDRDKLKMKNE
ncbi:hypothetical protein, partial [Proteiniphilum sp. X52]|uniref:hypothetical protein n=1 Tax=Proteiniphilum sp. X52 TaxID=2382159 RepID=UPI001C884F24